MDIQYVNSMNYEKFSYVFGNVIEKCPLVAAAVWSKRPFKDILDLENNIEEFIDSLPQSGKEGILRCHPDLAGKDFLSGSLTVESQGEQRSAGLTTLTPGQVSQLQQLNTSYRDRFHFPFVVCARKSDKDTIIQQLSLRVHNPPEQELLIGMEEVKKICHLRLLDIFDQVSRL
ncbi:2-oxo-4-hydroxy-4-carboxy-5-ureidoimidazoline decarboxylase [Callorhinchus milii]|uniref:2-oxo-4-hydroxy-4-carboxy-5-ureidoimidazoline decarboxylase n=1 Tax=Callorhinchus milii TaxID=7868 RepID=A0A4W3HQT0_CALMI|nr:2-oxo-4-hydroxy-4-carboxy-5-ureidoimidazoline decarboxylase [Callorhinchus milii]|eukprot:gi/632965253/ref/XP_007898798.1/ PREDICTED: putative 2-oxo-4-hydroxy-4-carboxy-5-ureidoimidazoline decarboxylase [Callorhinchus milii]